MEGAGCPCCMSEPQHIECLPSCHGQRAEEGSFMDTEFHYWVTGIIAREAGFSEREASIIAYSSEYVDENDICYSIEDRSTGWHLFQGAIKAHERFSIKLLSPVFEKISRDLSGA